MAYFLLVQWELGEICAVHTKNGLRAILLGENHEYLKKEVLSQFPEAKQAPTHHKLHSIMQALINEEKTRICPYGGPLDIQGTDFQKTVWDVLQTIPFGHTMTYSAVALKLGKPKAYRAVARACAVNPLPLVIPCHRVVGAQGLRGYRFGLPLKIALLEKEKALKKQYQDISNQ